MLKIYPDTKVYVLCPANAETGGPESLHQLASQILSLGVETYMFYCVKFGEVAQKNPVERAFKKYHLPYVWSFEDAPHNILITSEVTTDIGAAYAKKCRRVTWWLSVNNYLENILNLIKVHMMNPLAEPVPKFFYFDKADKNIEHWAQSEYVRQFLRLNGVTNAATVETHMSQIFLTNAAQIDLAAKKNFVAYNPRKGFDVTRKLIESAPDIDWRPIEKMTPAQVQKLLAEAKVYIDFGNFPGRERLPREATLSGCVVITGKHGAAGNDVDINIPAEFKFDDSEPQLVIEKIRDVLENFEENLDKQKAFREKEMSAQKRFAEKVAAALGIKKLPPPSVAFVQGVCEESFLLVEEFIRRKDFAPKFIVDDLLATTKISDGLIHREQNRNYLRVGKNLVEIITRDDAKFLYREGRIKKFALLAPKDEELADLKNFYGADEADVLLFER